MLVKRGNTKIMRHWINLYGRWHYEMGERVRENYQNQEKIYIG
jgi:hypothetical protein